MKGKFEILELGDGNICQALYRRTGLIVEVEYEKECLNEMFATTSCEEPRQQGTFRNNGQLLIGPVEY